MGCSPSLGVGKLWISTVRRIFPYNLFQRLYGKTLLGAFGARVTMEATGVHYRKPLVRSSVVRLAVEILATFGTAWLFGYLILQSRW
jgi:hypothetical protein